MEELSFGRLQKENEELRERIRRLEFQLKEKEFGSVPSSLSYFRNRKEEIDQDFLPKIDFNTFSLNKDDIQRYGRQLILNEIGIVGSTQKGNLLT
jgi:hypothetical protein